tara:strand:- start:2177 stop:2461 length:285 start_codon:yes stop_codon:yes gene_type:complete
MPRKNGTRRNIRTIERIVKLIDESDEGELSTLQIHDGFLEKWINGTPTKARLGNLLAKCREFEQAGSVVITSGYAGQRYPVAVWRLRDEAATNY